MFVARVRVGIERGCSGGVHSDENQLLKRLSIQKSLDWRNRYWSVCCCQVTFDCELFYLNILLFQIEEKRMYELYIVMELASGGDLRNQLRRVCSRTTPAELLNRRPSEEVELHSKMPIRLWIEQILNAVRSLHFVG